jgi:hypothetical protein
MYVLLATCQQKKGLTTKLLVNKNVFVVWFEENTDICIVSFGVSFGVYSCVSFALAIVISFVWYLIFDL